MDLGDEEVKTFSLLFLLSLYLSVPMYLSVSVPVYLSGMCRVVQSCIVWVMRKSRQVEQR